MSDTDRLDALEKKIDALVRLVQTQVVDQFPGLLNRISGIEGGVSYASNLYLQAQRQREAIDAIAASAEKE